ncbi:MAG: DMT family transporter [Rhodoferax sp.]|jgi:drug/metabolite transporter (DMT)-like permease|uniref:DMT family transporter n=1 Tax=Rhodoferax sp. TaxID=50421 RepID=UPI001B5DB0A1|nr:DMT family transporter [Rhodoferax sp.]MBP8286888.1 DMT family transporter [Rhodoferax sp.]MBP9148442.1 DMT family transporter [Rhodoferax sp.]MBP9737163.1 DMT family transporter [Rhodoferax sp.]
MTSPYARALPLLFVLLWSTGFIGARLGLPHAEPLTFLLIRYLAVISLMGLVAGATRAPWPASPMIWLHIGVTGLLVHGVYLGGVFTAISKGLPAGVASLVVGVQPLLTAVGAGWLLGETVVRRQWIGLVLGFLGVGLVVFNKLGTGFGIAALVPALLALLGITVGTLYQKRYCPSFDWRTGSVAQFLPTAVATGLVAYWTEDFRVDWTGEFLFALGWLVFVLSLGAISLLNWLIRHSNAVNIASLFYLVPPCTALVAWVLFGESFSGFAMVGMAMAVWGVYLARK